MFDFQVLRSEVLGFNSPEGPRKQDKGIHVNATVKGANQVLALVISHCISSYLTCVTHPNKLAFTPVNLKA